MVKQKTIQAVFKIVFSNPQLIRVSPKINFFLLKYLKKFPIVQTGRNFIIHSHLPPLNSRAYSRFVTEHLIQRVDGPSHAQIGITNACPQNCEYCYNKDRRGRVMDTNTILKVIADLKKMGLVWLGLTGGEPLLNRDIVKIVESAGDDCAKKLFTTGCTLTKSIASDLKSAGVFSVSVSLDHWLEEEHDRVRRYRGAFKTALKAIDILRNLNDIHVSVSTVLPIDLIRENRVEEFLTFLINLGVHEAWLSEAKPSVEEFWKNDRIITEAERLYLCRLQDRYNKDGKITVNYLSHFEGREHFGCNAGNKMVYVDAFGDVSPCVFIPMNFGNVKESSIRSIIEEMKHLFPTEDTCFINKNYRLLSQYGGKGLPIDKRDSLRMLDEVMFGPLSYFNRLYKAS
ncbi:MAG: radical SAM protein [Spirochaetes bacterium DG_61]|jgi:MoaA/NifB/PqqE/SkfB family radical SAM enzyme|nr:MAG: radical SAM protein [Spirochaetes bacterium DG_61]